MAAATQAQQHEQMLAALEAQAAQAANAQQVQTNAALSTGAPSQSMQEPVPPQGTQAPQQ